MFAIQENQPFFFNSLPINAVVTLTFTVTGDDTSTGWAISNVPANATVGPTVITLRAGQTATVAFDVAANGGYLVNVGPDTGALALMNYEVENILWGHG